MTRNYIRKPKNIYKQFWIYLLSSFCISIALALNEFLNGIIVSNFLGGQALATINLTIPLTLVAASFYTLCGFGPSVAVGNVLGKSDVKEADRIFTVSLIFLLVVGLVFSLLGVVFRNNIAESLAGENKELLTDIATMVGIMSGGGLFLLFLPFTGYFIKVEGKPGYAVLLISLANVFNVVLTALFIKIFNMGVESAALSVVSGYFISFIVFIVLIVSRKIPLRLTKVRLKDFSILGSMLTTGLPAAVSLLLLALQINVLNRLSFEYSGVDGLVVFSVCLGAYSLTGMFYQGVTDTLPPILSVLRGAEDVNGQRFIIKKVFQMSAILSGCFFIIFELFPQFVMKLYNLDPRLHGLAEDCIRLYTIGMSLTVFVLFFLDYLQSIERKVFAMVVSVLKNIGCVLPFAWLFAVEWGIRGITLAFSLGTVITFLIIAAHNLHISMKSGRRFRGILLLPNGNTADRFEATIPFNEKAIVELSEEIGIFCNDKKINKKTGYLISLAVEEMALITINNHDINNQKKLKKDSIDVFLSFDKDMATLVFCVSGKPFDLYDHIENNAVDEEISNIMVLKKISSSMSFERILLMNRTIIRFNHYNVP